jgi:hypothetical protein
MDQWRSDNADWYMGIWNTLGDNHQGMLKYLEALRKMRASWEKLDQFLGGW